MPTDPTPAPARDLDADLAFLAEKDRLTKQEFSVEDDVEISGRARRHWPGDMAELLRLRARVAELEAELRRVAPFLAMHRYAGYSLEVK